MYEEYSETFDKGIPLIDKTDWRSKIRDALWDCIKTSGWYPQYIWHVRALIDTFSAEYPGWDAKGNVEKKVADLEQKYSDEYDKWLSKNETARIWKKKLMKQKMEISLHHEIFEYIKNMYARKRGLLYGVKKGMGGKQLPDED